MAQVVWTERAFGDLREIHDYIARDSRFYARVTVEKLRSAVARLGTFPESGRAVPEFLVYREVVRAPYRIIYRHEPASGRVLIMAVVHGARPLRNDL